VRAGEDTFVRSDGGYAGERRGGGDGAARPEVAVEGACPPAHVEDTPDTPTIESLVDLANGRFPRVGPGVDRGRHV
jgi:prolyl-tRNA synthetase